jgi:hypothetical protein
MTMTRNQWTNRSRYSVGSSLQEVAATTASTAGTAAMSANSAWLQRRGLASGAELACWPTGS